MKLPVFTCIDSIQLYVENLQQGLQYYCNCLGLAVIWKSDSAIGLGMKEGVTELVIQNERRFQEVDIKVNSVIDAVVEIEKAGGKIINGPFDIAIGKCAVVQDPWHNQYVILDATNGTFVTDQDGTILGHHKP